MIKLSRVLNIVILNLMMINGIIAQKEYFQQQSDITINVKLDDIKHTLQGDYSINYTNNSLDTLSFIYMHIWANAYKDRFTKFAGQQLRNRNLKFYFSKDNEKGYYKDLLFYENGALADVKSIKGYADIVKIILATPLLPGEKVNLKTDIKLKIPASFSRLGHVGTSYQITQWYPKPAVYDRKGWHPMPYLDQGEFYSEFGTMNVNLTLPKNYLVGATGVLVTESEKQYLEERIDYSTRQIIENKAPSIDFPMSSDTFKTISFVAENVHDFAWFADKRFLVQKGNVNLSSGRSVETYSYFTGDDFEYWKKAVDYVNNAVKFYSEKVGEYPYPQASAVQSALSAGGGMEYPMITVIGRTGSAYSLDEVIAHEVGHNWFYGILASNERDHPWMDEGVNSYIEKLYTDHYYPKSKSKQNESNLIDFGIAYFNNKEQDQSPNLNSDLYSNINYGLCVYQKPTSAFMHFRSFLGEEKAEKAMQYYYDTWKFKHPYPDDMKKCFELICEKKLDWLFDGLLGTNKKSDFRPAKIAVKEGNTIVTIQNKRELDYPIPVTLLKNREQIITKWTEGVSDLSIVFPGTGYDAVQIDNEGVTNDINLKNNQSQIIGDRLKASKRFKFGLGAGIEKPNENRVNWLPVPFYNSYDKFSLGLLIHNSNLPIQNFEFQIMPSFGFGSKIPIGTANLGYHHYNRLSKISSWDINLNFRKYSEDNTIFDDIPKLGYWRLIPEVGIQFRTNPNESRDSRLSIRSIIQNKESIDFDTLGNKLANNLRWVNQIRYHLIDQKALNPYSIVATVEQQQYKSFTGRSEQYIKLDLETKFAFHYAPKKKFDFRIFAGYFINNSQQDNLSFNDETNRGFYSLMGNGLVDYYKEYALIGRNDASGLFGQQNVEIMGGFKNRFEYERSFNNSSYYIASLNAKVDLPQTGRFFPLKPYVDIGYAYNPDYDPQQDVEGFESPFSYTAGLMLDFADGLFGVQFPIFYSNNISRVYREENGNSKGLNKYEKQITFTLNLNKLNPFNYTHKAENLLRGFF